MSTISNESNLQPALYVCCPMKKLNTSQKFEALYRVYINNVNLPYTDIKWSGCYVCQAEAEKYSYDEEMSKVMIRSDVLKCNECSMFKSSSLFSNQNIQYDPINLSYTCVECTIQKIKKLGRKIYCVGCRLWKPATEYKNRSAHRVYQPCFNCKKQLKELSVESSKKEAERKKQEALEELLFYGLSRDLID